MPLELTLLAAFGAMLFWGYEFLHEAGSIPKCPVSATLAYKTIKITK